MASIYPRGKTYWIKYYKDGICYRESLKTRDSKIAKYRLAVREKELVEGEVPPGLKKTKSTAALNEYLETGSATKGPGTLKVDNPRLKSFLEYSKVTELTQINRKVIEDYLTHRLREEKVKPLTYNHTLTIIKAWLNWCIKRGYLNHNPAQSIKKLKVEQNPPRYLTQQEITKLLNAAKEDVNIHLMIQTALYTGCRLGELLNLEWQDITQNKIIIKNKSGFQTKSKRFRTIPIHPKLKEELTRHQEDTGRCFNTKNLRKTFEKIKKQAMLTGIGWHNLRHTFASHLASQGVSLHIIAKLLGHSDTQTTQIYAHLLPESLENAVEKLSFQAQI